MQILRFKNRIINNIYLKSYATVLWLLMKIGFEVDFIKKTIKNKIKESK